MHQYNRILNIATALQTSATNVNQHVTVFAENFAKQIITISNNLESIKTNLNTTKIENLAATKKTLQKCDHKLNHEFKKTIMQLQKQNAKLTRDLTQRVTPFTLSSEIDVTLIKQVAGQIEQLLQENSTKLEACCQAIEICQTKIIHLYQIISSLELPDDLIMMTKEVEQATQTLAILNAKILNDQKVRENYESEFKHLETALEDLNVESSKIFTSHPPSSPN